MASQIILKTILSTFVLASQATAYQSIAHRGLFHDVTDNTNVAENTIGALQRAYELGLPGVEFDLRLTSDGTVMVTHDILGNRATVADNAGGVMNAIGVALNLQSKPAPNYINSHSLAYWDDVLLKTYGRNGKIVKTDGAQRMETLDNMLMHLKNLNAKNFFLVLDIQDPAILNTAGELVKLRQVESQVYLKFFAVKAIDSSKYKYAGADTCYNYALDHHISGLNIIPQINDGELTINGRTATLGVFQTQLSVQDYLNCWSNAQRAHADAAKIIMVSASVPADNAVAYNAAGDALTWAKQNGRKTISILPNPDAGRLINNKCVLWTFQSNAVNAATFDGSARSAKDLFISSLNPDYVIVDLMGDVKSHSWTGDYNKFIQGLC